MKIILVIEDDHDTRVSIRSVLESADYHVASAANGADALELLDDIGTPNAVLLDISMPIMNGEQFLKHFRQEPRYASVPVIQMSASHVPQLDGTCCVLEKPLQLKDLIDAVAKYTSVLATDPLEG